MRHAITITALGSLLALSACGPQYDPLSREGLFQPLRANRADLALEAANPADLVRGTGRSTSDGQAAVAAVDRLRQDKVKKLPASDVSTIAAGASGDNSGGGGGGGGASGAQ